MQKIGLALDFPDGSEELLGLKEAQQLAQGLKGRLWLLHVEPPEPDFVGYDVGPQPVRDAVASEAHRHHRQLQAAAQRCREAGVETTALLLQGPTVESLIEKADELELDMLLVGAHRGSTLRRLFLGSVSDGLLRQAHCPVMLIKPPPGEEASSAT